MTSTIVESFTWLLLSYDAFRITCHHVYANPCRGLNSFVSLISAELLPPTNIKLKNRSVDYFWCYQHALLQIAPWVLQCTFTRRFFAAIRAWMSAQVFANLMAFLVRCIYLLNTKRGNKCLWYSLATQAYGVVNYSGKTVYFGGNMRFKPYVKRKNSRIYIILNNI